MIYQENISATLISRLDEVYSKLLDHRKYANCTGYRMRAKWKYYNHVIREGNRYFLKEKREYMKDKMKELETNNENKNITDLYKQMNSRRVEEI